MVGGMPYDQSRKQLLNERIEKQEDDAGGKAGLRSAKHLVLGLYSLASRPDR